MVGYALIGLTLASAIIGTLSEANRQIKVFLIGFACLASAAAAWLQFESDEDAKLNQKLIASLVQSQQNDFVWAEDLRIGANAALANTDLSVSGLVFSDLGLIVGLSTVTDEATSSVVFLDQKNLRPLRYAYVAEKGLIEALEQALVLDVWNTSSVADDWNKHAIGLSEIVEFAIESIEPFNTEKTRAFPNGDSVLVKAPHPTSAVKEISIELSSSDITSLSGLLPAERGRKILELVQLSYVEQL